MTHDQVTLALAKAYPGIEWSYNGDGASLDAVYADDGQLTSRGLEWNSDTPAPTLDQLSALLVEAELTQARNAKQGEVIAALESSDKWIIRATESGVQVSPERTTYRALLRELYDEAASSDDPASIVIPNPPPFSSDG